jgi:beta-glucosidase
MEKVVSEAEIEGQIETLLQQMTQEEKIGQLNLYSDFWDVTGPVPKDGDPRASYEDLKQGKVGALLNVAGAEKASTLQKLVVEETRLKIPLLFGYDIIHGYQTMLPVPLGESSSWNPCLIELGARIAAREASAAGINWTYAPMVDITRDARWGRIMEGGGEDPFLGSAIAAARVRGFQGASLRDQESIAACAKHFAGYGFVEGGKDYNTADISDATFYDMVLPPFRAAIQEGAATVMTSLHEMNGRPTSGDEKLLREILRTKLGFGGVIVSDWNSIGEMVAHGVVADNYSAAQLAFRASIDIDMEGRCYHKHLSTLLAQGIFTEELLNESVRRILRLKHHLGLFSDPYRACTKEREQKIVGCSQNVQGARSIARSSIVLLKNEGQLLPLAKNHKILSVIGPLAADKDVPLGSWRAKAIPNSAVSLLEGVQAAVDQHTTVLHHQGVALAIGERAFARELTLNVSDRSGIPEAQKVAASSEVVIMAIGEDCFQSGEGRSQVAIGLSGLQEELLQAVLAVNKNVVVVLLNGRPLALEGIIDQVPAVVEAWLLGSESGHAIADVLFGEYNPSGRLPVSFPRRTGQTPIYYNRKSTGRGVAPTDPFVFWTHFTDVDDSPLFPFGFGLSYTKFSYSNLKLSSPILSPTTPLTITVDVANVGTVGGTETVQLYIRDVLGSVARPVKELKGFCQVTLDAGTSTSCPFTLNAESLKFYLDGELVNEAGEYLLWVGPDSTGGLEGRFQLEL